MSGEQFDHSPWYHATTLTERLTTLRTSQNYRLNVDVNMELAERRVQRWRSQPPFATGVSFAQRLALDDMSEEELCVLLGEPIDAVRLRSSARPAWLVQVERAFSRAAALSPMPVPTSLCDQATVGFLAAIEPLLSEGRTRLHTGVQALLTMRSDLPFDPRTVEDLLYASLPGQLLRLVSRTMVLELHVARLQGLLAGETTTERFQSFLHRIRQRDVTLAILQEYPVLARQLTTCINHWVVFSLEFLRHLCVDWDAVRAAFSPHYDPGVLTEVKGNTGDSHRRGRSVVIAVFSSGFQVVYKPRSLELDQHFQRLLTWINARSDSLPFRTVTILDRGTYGWGEFIAPHPCHSVAEVQRFYERQGGYLALLYALEATDFHCENLIAASEHPVLIDLEALFHPRVGGVDRTHAEQLAGERLHHSVLSVGLLPQRLWANTESEGLDISGLGATPGQLTPFTVPQIEGAGTDEMRYTRKQMPMSGEQNRPTLNGNTIDILDYADAITRGFANIYRLLLRHRDALLAAHGPLACFAHDEVRVILRGTHTYGVLLYESVHPDVLRSALDRERLFDRLWVTVEPCPYLARVIPHERDDLHEGDVPLFTTRPDSCDLWSSRNERIPAFFEQSGMTLVHDRVQRLSHEDLERQLWIVRASLATVAMDTERGHWPRYHLTAPRTEASEARLLAGARAIADHLDALALRGEDDICWVGLTLSGARHWSLFPLGHDLYDGLPGIALFLAYLGAVVGERHYEALARVTLNTLRRQVARVHTSLTSIGGFDGWSGVMYTLTHLGTLWDQPELVTEAEAIVERLPQLIEQDALLDIIAGAAGCIGSLLSLHHCRPSDRILEVATHCGDRLIARAEPMAQGIGWRTRLASTQALAGFSHGAAGIAWALLALAAATGQERFRTAALNAIAYERSLFSPEAGNWPDLRDAGPPPQGAEATSTFPSAWCHGAPGIGLARLQGLRHLDDAHMRAEIDVALHTTLAQGFGGNHSLCHGDLGNLEFLLQASRVFDDPAWHSQVRRIAGSILESIERDGWLCGVPLGVESPGLMTGLAGIGYGLLRLAAPARVPSVLVLEPPPETSTVEI